MSCFQLWLYTIFLQIFLPFLDVDASCGIVDLPATHIVDERWNIGSGIGMDSSVVAVHAGNGETEAGELGIHLSDSTLRMQFSALSVRG